MSRRKRARHNNRWPKGTKHYVLYADGTLDPIAIEDESLYAAKRDIQDGIAYDKRTIAEGQEIDDINRLVALVHVMPKVRHV